MDKERYYIHFRVGLVGETEVGKTNIASRFAKDSFSDETLPTVAISNSFQKVKKNNLNIELQIHDLGGQEKYREVVVGKHMKELDGCFIVYDITNEESFKKIDEWYNKIKEDELDIPIILIGNKCDLEDSREVSSEEAEEKAKELNCPFYETSAKDSTNINEIFKKMTDLIFEKKYPKNKMLI